MFTRTFLLTAAVLLVSGSASVHAAPVSDVVLDEVRAPLDVGINGSVVAYTHRTASARTEVVIRLGAAAPRRIAAGKGYSPVDVGVDRRGRRVVGFQRCAARCDLMTVPVVGGRPRVVARIERAADLTIGRGRIFWIEQRQVRSRLLAGGPIRREAVASGVRPQRIDTDGRTLAVTGEMVYQDINGKSGLSVTRPGSGRARLRGSKGFGEQYEAIRSPAVTPNGITSLYETSEASGGPTLAHTFAVFADGDRGYDLQTTGGMHVLEWDAAGNDAVFIHGATDAGCVIGDALEGIDVGAAPCRIVRADLSGERRLAPMLVESPPMIVGSVAITQLTVQVMTLADGKITSRVGVPGIAVEYRDDKGTILGRTVTDEFGRMRPTTVLPSPKSSVAVVAATTPPSYAFLL